MNPIDVRAYYEHEVELWESSDYYHHFRLRQPKAEIADYLESQGILTPKRYGSLEEALLSGKPFIIRGELHKKYLTRTVLFDNI